MVACIPECSGGACDALISQLPKLGSTNYHYGEWTHNKQQNPPHGLFICVLTHPILSCRQCPPTEAWKIGHLYKHKVPIVKLCPVLLRKYPSTKT